MTGEPHRVRWLKLELTNNCNFNCSFCTQQFMKRPKGYMDKKLAMKIIDEFSVNDFSDVLGFQFMGEILLHPDGKEILRYAKAKGVSIKLVTNGALFTDEMIEAVLDSSIVDVYISYFTPDKDSFALRRAGTFDHQLYQSRVQKLVRAKLERSSPMRISLALLNTRYCLMPGIRATESAEEAREEIYGWMDFVDSCIRETGKVPPKRDRAPIEAEKYFSEYWTYSLGNDITMVSIEVGTWANQLLINNGVTVTPVMKGSCPHPFEHLFICWDGRCTCCCLDYDCKLEVGDVNHQTIAEVLDGEKLKAIQSAMKRNEFINPYCQTCRGTIDMISYLRKSSLPKALSLFFNRKKLGYLLSRGWRRFSIPKLLSATKH